MLNKNPRVASGISSMLCIQYSGWNGTYTPSVSLCSASCYGVFELDRSLAGR